MQQLLLTPEKTTAYALKSGNKCTSFNYPVTFVFGMKDIALDPRIVCDGIERCFRTDSVNVRRADTGHKYHGGDSHVVALDTCGHWPMNERDGRIVLERVVGWCTRSSREDQAQGLEEALRDVRSMVKLRISTH